LTHVAPYILTNRTSCNPGMGHSEVCVTFASHSGSGCRLSFLRSSND